MKSFQIDSCGYYNVSTKDIKFGDKDLAKVRARVKELGCSEEEVKKWMNDLKDKE